MRWNFGSLKVDLGALGIAGELRVGASAGGSKGVLSTHGASALEINQPTAVVAQQNGKFPKCLDEHL